MKKSLNIALKLSFAGASLFLIGSLFLVVNPEKKDEVIKNAHADIYTFTGIDEENNFRRAIEAMGIRPRAYDFNGNLMYFGQGNIAGSRSAAETAYKVQDQLVLSGVNSKNYLGEAKNTSLYDPNASAEEKKNSKELREAIFEGELLPYKQGKHFYQMTSMVGLGSLDSFKEKMKGKTKEEILSLDPSENIKGYRYIDISQSEGSRTAEIVAVWTDENYDPKKMLNESDKQSPADPSIPACIGCKRVRRVQALDSSEPYNVNKWVTQATVSQTYDFYLQAMENRGWKESGKQQMLNKFAERIPSIPLKGGRGLALEKNGKVINITILPNKNGGAGVFSIEKYLDNQSFEKSVK